jgi:hypothetical protein
MPNNSRISNGKSLVFIWLGHNVDTPLGLNEYNALLIYYNILDKINLIYELKK